MPEAIRSSPVVFVHYSGTENGLANRDTTACSDSLASMIANGIFILESVPSQFEDTVAPARDSSKYEKSLR